MKEKEEIISEFLATAEQYEAFISRSVIWRDMKGIVEAWKQEGIKALVDPSQTNTMEAVADYQGRIYMCNQFLEFPETALEEIKLKEKE